MTALHSPELRLAPRALHSISDAAGLQIDCREGSVWVTLDGDEHDYVLEAGETFSTREHGRVVVYAFEPSLVQVAPKSAPMQVQRNANTRWPEMALTR